MPCDNSYWVVPAAKFAGLAASPLLPFGAIPQRLEGKELKLTRHNGRAGKNGTYNPKHNDRRFDVEHSEHINPEMTKKNVYWDCYTGIKSVEFRENPGEEDFSFEEIEKLYYVEHYGDYVDAQNARNEKARHTERNRTVEDLLCKATLKVLEKRMEQSKAMIFVVSENSLHSIWCKYELNYFTELGKPIYCISKEAIDEKNFHLDKMNDTWFLDSDYKTLALIEGESINV